MCIYNAWFAFLIWNDVILCTYSLIPVESEHKSIIWVDVTSRIYSSSGFAASGLVQTRWWFSILWFFFFRLSLIFFSLSWLFFLCVLGAVMCFIPVPSTSHWILWLPLALVLPQQEPVPALCQFRVWKHFLVPKLMYLRGLIVFFQLKSQSN